MPDNSRDRGRSIKLVRSLQRGSVLEEIMIGGLGIFCAIIAMIDARAQEGGSYVPAATFKNAALQGAGAYGLAFVAPSTYGYGDRGAYAGSKFAGPGAFGFGTAASAGLGPGRYAFPVFDHNQGHGGFGSLGYYGTNLGFAFPGHGYGNGIFGARAYPNPFV